MHKHIMHGGGTVNVSWGHRVHTLCSIHSALYRTSVVDIDTVGMNSP